MELLDADGGGGSEKFECWSGDGDIEVGDVGEENTGVGTTTDIPLARLGCGNISSFHANLHH